MQCIHWHIPSLIRNLGSSCAEMLDIIHNSPEGTDHLVTLVSPFYLTSLYITSNKMLCVLIVYFLILKIVQTLTEESNPSVDLVAAVKHLYKTKLKVCIISYWSYKFYSHLTCYIFFRCTLNLVIPSCRMHLFSFLCCLHFQRKRYYMTFYVSPACIVFVT